MPSEAISPQALPAPPAPGRRSSFEALMRLAEAAGPLKISFEDLVGMTQDHAELALPEALRLHTAPLCRWAKKHVRRGHGLHACAANKYLANREVQRQQGTVVGACHMGLTDICHPLVYRRQVMGVFYYGSVIVEGQLPQVRRLAVEAARIQQADPAAALEAVEQMPVISRRELADYETRLRELAHVVALLMDGLGLPADCYHPYNRAYDARVAYGGTPRLVVRAVRTVAAHYDKPLSLPVLAQRLNCRPDYLRRLFRRAMGMTLAEHIERVRIERACKLLQLSRLDITRIAYEVGFTDKSNFARSFRRVIGTTPGEYRRRAAAEGSGRAAFDYGPDQR